MRIRNMLMATVLASTLWLTACVVPAWVSQAESIANVAVPIAGSIVDIVDPALAPLVTLVEGGFAALTKTLDTYKAQPTATNLQAVQAAFASINSNITQLEQAAQIKNTNSQQEVAGVIALLGQAVSEIAALVPAPLASQLRISKDSLVAPARGWNANDFKNAFNSITKKDPRFKPFNTKLLGVI